MSVTKDQLIQFIERPGLLKEQTIAELKEIVEEFPYFQSAQLLYTYNLHSQANFRYEAYLKTCSIYATDRSVLYRLLQPGSAFAFSARQEVRVEQTTHEPASLFELLEEKQVTQSEFSELAASDPTADELIDFDLLSFDQTDDQEAAHVTANGLENPVKTVQSETVEQKGEGKLDLIDQFIKVNPTIQPLKEISNAENELFELREDTEAENDEFITETLSRIYLKQGHYQKAIDSFRRLSLKFPEKSVYFAEQIEEIKKLLN